MVKVITTIFFLLSRYSSSMKNLNNKFIHLTNYSVNKKNSEYKANGDDAVCQGHKWYVMLIICPRFTQVCQNVEIEE